MLQVVYTTDKKVLEPLYKTLYPQTKISGVNAVLYDGPTPAGLCTLEIGDNVRITRFALADGHAEDADFFFRVILFKLSFNDYIVEVDGQDKRLLKFGFKEEDGKMRAASKQIVFPSSCGRINKEV